MTQDVTPAVDNGKQIDVQPASPAENPGNEPQSGNEPAGSEKLTYEEKLALATTDAERFAIANAEAAKNRRLLGKAQKPAQGTPQPANVPAPQSSVSVEETVLRANGMPVELLTQLKDVAKLRGVSLLDAQSDPLFIGIKANHDKEERQKQASLGASNGSGRVAPKKDFNTPGLTAEEHRAMFKEHLANS